MPNTKPQRSHFRQQAFRPLTYAVDAVKNAVGQSVQATARDLIRSALRQALDEMYDGWETETSADDENAMHHRVMLEITRRLNENELEETDEELAAIRANQMDPTKWPDAPPLMPDPFEWLRARVLYSYCPADCDSEYAVRYERWMLILPTLLICPGIANLVWFLLLLLLVTTRRDPYQLLSGIWRYKQFAFVFWGVLPILVNHVILYFLATAQADQNGWSPADEVFSWFPSWARALLSVAFQLEITCLYMNWMLCYVLFWKARRSIKQKEANEFQGIYTADGVVDTRTITAVMLYDAAVFVLFTVVQQLYLTYVVLGRSGVGALLSTADPLAIEGAMLEPVPAALRGQYLFHRVFAVNALALAMLPHLAFLLPFVGELLHQVRITGYDRAGMLHVMMPVNDMQAKWRAGIEGGEAWFAARKSPSARITAVVDDFLTTWIPGLQPPKPHEKPDANGISNQPYHKMKDAPNGKPAPNGKDAPNGKGVPSEKDAPHWSKELV